MICKLRYQTDDEELRLGTCEMNEDGAVLKV